MEVRVCGIAGIVVTSSSGAVVSESDLRRMCRALAARGPDGEGVWVSEDGRVGLGHRRLAVVDLDLSAGQPMANADGSVQVTYNGEIYNHALIRAELRRLGHERWRTDHSDTEVIVQGYEQWGIACLERLRGMFAFALWDKAERCLWLVRDRMGVKPVYYTMHDGVFSFASTLDALTCIASRTPDVDPSALFDYLGFLTVPAPRTIYSGYRKLQPGTWLRVAADGELTEGRYWDLAEASSTLDLSGITEDEAAERLLAILRESVEIRHVADVPRGIFLSGGVDSTAIAGLCPRSEVDPLRAFSVTYGMDDSPQYLDETSTARATTSRLAAQHTEKRLDVQSFLASLDDVAGLQDEPIADPVCFPLLELSAEARAHGVVVCQTGEGADELFRGYPGWLDGAARQRLLDQPALRPFRRAMLTAARVAGKGSSFHAEWARRSLDDQPLFWGGVEAFTDSQKRRLLSGSAMRDGVGDRSSWDAVEPHWRRYNEASTGDPGLPWMTYLDFQIRLPELLLSRTDRMSMGVGLEIRTPFLDHHLVEFAFALPSALVTRHRTPKYILKRSLTCIVPDSILWGPKQGFSVPVDAWLGQLLDTHLNGVLDAFCSETGWFTREAVRGVMLRGELLSSWSLINLALWWNSHLRCH